ncbi:MAG TPA: DUF1629 domain-containing protein [Tahibacter sp.]|uniref:imm11 family protein n=1 Tax=Tahibacter sp. TaxID=2056211 RepID=UPI002C336619|nr:DUF1629 domain-containing protein [Tahibacter sp.]HSX59208.1 DUF1629 domain-containing protein [Tahibacter sp.]
MKHYILTQKKEPGCPLGLLNGILHRSFVENAHACDYGDYPWYADPSSGRPHRPFPEGLVFVTEDARYTFDLRSDSRFFYLASNELVAACRHMNVRFEDLQRVDVVSRRGSPVSGNTYWVCRFEAFPVADVIDPANSSIESSDGVHTRIRRLRIREDFDQDLFKLRLLPPETDSLFCSQRFFEFAQQAQFKGIAFADVATFDWPAEMSAADQFAAAFSGAAMPRPI